MSIEITDRTLAMWCVLVGDFGNTLGHITRREDGQIQIDVRFRWYRDAVIGPESKDERTQYQILTKDPEAVALAKFREIFEQYRRTVPGRQGWELLRGERTAEEFMHLIGTMPGMHLREEAP